MSDPDGAAGEGQEPPRPPGHGRLIVSIVLLAVAVFIAPLFLVSVWANVQITNTDRYVRTVSSLADDPQVQQYLAKELTAAFTDNVDVRAAVDELLPADLQPLDGPISHAVTGFVATAANDFTASSEFKTLWVDANRAAHRIIVGVLTGDLHAADLENGQLTINLGDALRSLQQRLVGQGFEIAGRVDLSGVNRQVVLAEGAQIDDIEQARRLVGLLEDLVWVLGILTVAAAVASVLVAPRKAHALVRLGVGLALVMVVVAIGIAVTRNAFLSSLGPTVPQPVVAAFFDALVDSMRFGFRVVFALGLVIAILVAIANLPDYPARWSRPTQIGVVTLGVIALLARNDLTWGYVIAIVIAEVVTLVILEALRRRPFQDEARPTTALSLPS